MSSHGVDWTQVLLYGVPAYIAALGGATAAIITALNRRSLKTANGKTIGEQVEATHTAVMAAEERADPLASPLE